MELRAPGRIFTTPVINLSTAEGAVEELEWALERGAKTVLVRPGPVAGFRGPQSPFLPFGDPFWRSIEEAGIPVMLHASNCGYKKYSNEWTGPTARCGPSSRTPSATSRSRSGRSWTPSSRPWATDATVSPA